MSDVRFLFRPLRPGRWAIFRSVDGEETPLHDHYKGDAPARGGYALADSPALCQAIVRALALGCTLSPIHDGAFYAYLADKMLAKVAIDDQWEWSEEGIWDLYLAWLAPWLIERTRDQGGVLIV